LRMQGAAQHEAEQGRHGEREEWIGFSLRHHEAEYRKAYGGACHGDVIEVSNHS
jgi:hypothetical protein